MRGQRIPFAELARRHGDDLAVIWIDSHPGIGTPDSAYKGYHAMAVTALTGHGDPDVRDLLPATVSPDRIALVGLHEWTDDGFPHIAAWGIQSFSPGQLRASTGPLLDWLGVTGCSRVAVHFDVDTIDSNEGGLGLGFMPGGLTSSAVRRIVADIDQAADVVGLTIAEFAPPAGHAPPADPQGLPLAPGRVTCLLATESPLQPSGAPVCTWGRRSRDTRRHTPQGNAVVRPASRSSRGNRREARPGQDGGAAPQLSCVL